jgi:hypothetical protein
LVNDSDRIGLMPVVMCGVDSESGRFGKIQTDYVKRFIVKVGGYLYELEMEATP